MTITRKNANIESKYVINTGFDPKLAHANVITKRHFDAKIIELENNIKKLHLIRPILEEKVILRRMVHKII